MFKITFLGAGSTVFAKNVLGDCILTPELRNFEAALFDIDLNRMEESRLMLENINKNYHGKAIIKAYTDRKKALQGADFIINAIQVGGYEPCTVRDFEIPKKYGLRQTIGDTLGIGGIFRALRTIPILENIAEDIHSCCPKALFINYANPMAILSGYMQRYLDINAIGICHSVQYVSDHILKSVGMDEYMEGCKIEVAGINHQAWVLKIKDKNGNDLYPEIKRRSKSGKYQELMKDDLVRHDIMYRFGYYVTESSEHSAEYLPYYIKSKYPELIEKFNIPLDELPRRLEENIKNWGKMREEVLKTNIEHIKSREYPSYLINAIVNDKNYLIYANVLNKNFITNLPYNACVEVPCHIDGNGVKPCYVGDLPEQCAALNRTNINVQNMTIEAAHARKKEFVYMAAYLDPHTSSELCLDEIKNLCDNLFNAHSDFISLYK